MTQAIPQMVMQGQDPTDLVSKLAAVIKMRQKGVVIEDAIEEVFKPENPPAGAEQPVEQPPVPAGPAAPAGGAGEAPQPGMEAGPGMVQQKPELQTLLAGLSSTGATKSSVRTSNRRVVG